MPITVSTNPSKNWGNNDIQFPRLIAEAEAAGLFDEKNERVIELMDSMDITPELLAELIDRASETWDDIKSRTIPPRR